MQIQSPACQGKAERPAVIDALVASASDVLKKAKSTASGVHGFTKKLLGPVPDAAESPKDEKLDGHIAVLTGLLSEIVTELDRIDADMRCFG